MNKTILFLFSFIAGNDAWSQQASTAALSDSMETLNSHSVEIAEDAPKVIINGKWGTEPGEFGYDGFYLLEGFVPKSPYFLPDDFIHPRSLAVDSKGNIYILDTANNRIQKFDSAGKYQRELKINAWSGYKKRQDGNDGYVYDVMGVNIVIDSSDVLYYYLRRMKDYKTTGEVWELKKDKVVRKTVMPWEDNEDALYHDYGLSLEADDSIWIYDLWEKGMVTSKHYEIKEKKIYTTKERNEKIRKSGGAYEEYAKIRPLDKIQKLDLQVTEEGVKVLKHNRK